MDGQGTTASSPGESTDTGLLHECGQCTHGEAETQSDASAALQLASSRALLLRAAPLLHLPTCPDQPPEVLSDGSGLRCVATGRVFPYRGGILDLQTDTTTLTPVQHMLDTPLTAWAYARFRDTLLPLLGLPRFATEVATTQATLRLEPGDAVLDLACGHGNFTAEWAKRVGPDGLVIGLDLSSAMLARAAAQIAAWGLDNVLLVHGDALRLPLAEGSITKVNCSGGFHQFPDLPQALREIARVSEAGGVLTASTFAEGPRDRRGGVKRWLRRRFALHFVPLEPLGTALAALGYGEYQWSLPGGWFGYMAARKVGA